jgi:hypothetical protein
MARVEISARASYLSDMNLAESARQWILRELPYNRGDPVLVTYLTGCDARRLLVVYHNWASRLVGLQPRRVHKSSAFQKNPLAAQRASDLAQIIADIQHGRDLKKYLSRDVVRAPAKAPGAGRRPDLDLMLNHWGVHHLHISTIVEADGFVVRGNPLLFICFRPNAAYLIDIMKHGDWTRDHVLEVLAGEWPNDGVIHEIKKVSGTSQIITESQRANLRGNGCNTAFAFGGKVFMPASLSMSGGTTFMASRWADYVLRKLGAFEQALIADPRCLSQDFERHGLVFPDVPALEFAIRDEGAVLVETKTGALMNVAPAPSCLL